VNGIGEDRAFAKRKVKQMLPNPNKLDVDIDGLHWFKMLAGLLVGTFGVLFISAPITIAMKGNLSALAGLICCGPAGLGFIVLGGWLAFNKSGVTLDLDAETITEWSGVFRWQKRKEHPLKDFGRVTLKHFERSGRGTMSEISERKSTHSAYTAELEGSGKKIVLMDWRVKDPVREKGQEVASFLKLPLIDRLETKETVTNPEDWDELLDE